MIILMYHNLLGEAEKNERSPYILSPLNFTNQMEYLHIHRYAIQSLDSSLASSKKVNLLKSVIITFDDGHISNYTIAYPTLLKYGFRAIFFIITGWIGKNDRISWAQLKEIRDGDMEIGSHTVTHPYLTKLSLKHIRFELEYSKKTLEDRLGKPVKFLSISRGLYSKRVKQIAKKVGYLGVCTSYVGVNGVNTDLYCLKRIGIGGDINLLEFSSLLKGKGILKRKISQSLYDVCKRILGIDNYLSLKKWLQKTKSFF